jgi:hypothetical protein
MADFNLVTQQDMDPRAKRITQIDDESLIQVP